MTDYALTLLHGYPDRFWKLDGDDYEHLTMLDDKDKPSKKELDEAWPKVKAKLQAEAAAKEATRAAALAKLGLTADEIAALFG